MIFVNRIGFEPESRDKWFQLKSLFTIRTQKTYITISTTNIYHFNLLVNTIMTFQSVSYCSLMYASMNASYLEKIGKMK